VRPAPGASVTAVFPSEWVTVNPGGESVTRTSTSGPALTAVQPLTAWVSVVASSPAVASTTPVTVTV